MSTELTTIEQEKGAAWAQLGIGIYNSELQLKESANKLLARLKTPTTIEEVQVAEVTLKNCKAEFIRIQNERKEITSRFDSVSSRLTEPEKSLIGPLTKFSESIIAIKADYEKKQKAVEEKAKEVTRIKEYLINQVNAFDANCKKLIADMISNSYTYALTLKDGKPRINTESKLADHIANVSGKLTVQSFIYNPPSPKVAYITEEEYAEMVMEIDIPADYVALFHSDLKKKYSDYDTAVSQVEKALELNKKEAADKEAKIEEEKKQKDIAAKLEALAVPEQTKADIKALKKSFAINMEETDLNAKLILVAFISNYTTLFPRVRSKKAFNLSVNNMITALESMKNDDNAFDCTGLVWKEVVKL